MNDDRCKPFGRLSLFKLTVCSVLFAYCGLILALLIANAAYVEPEEFWGIFRNPDLRYAAWLTLWTSLLSAALALLTAVPTAFALSRLRLPGKALLDALVDLPIVLPHLVIGVMLLVFFRTSFGQAVERWGFQFVFAPAGIVLAQYLCVSPFAVRTVKSAMDGVDPRLENVARTLGWSPGQAFLRVTLPMIRNGIVAGGVIAWALAMGLYGPLMIFAGTTRQRTEVLAASVYLELSVGRIGVALAVSMAMVIFAVLALWLFKRFAGGGKSPW